MECICDDEGKHDITCFICQKVEPISLPKITRQAKCPVHCVMQTCGLYEYACSECKELGWYSTAGFGGPTVHINKITGEKRVIPYEMGEIF